MEAKSEIKDKISDEARMIILHNIRQQWINTRESSLMQHRVFKRLNDEAAMKRIEKELEHCEIALDELDKMFSEIQKKE